MLKLFFENTLLEYEKDAHERENENKDKTDHHLSAQAMVAPLIVEAT